MRLPVRFLTLATVVAALSTAFSCGGPAAPALQQSQTGGIAIPAGRDVDDAARFLAGLPSRDGSLFSAAETDPAWQQHRLAMDGLWQKTGRFRLPGFERFQKAELNGASFDGGVLFYPFGGPDALTASLLFPRKNTYVLLGLEPPGSIPHEELLTPGERDRWLDGIRYALRSVVQSSFFITNQMKRDLRGRSADGVLPLMLTELVRTGHKIAGVRAVEIDAEGELIPREGSAPVDNPGVAVVFTRDGETRQRRIVYFSADLSSPKFDGNKALRAHLKSLGVVTTFLKAASYLPHRQGFNGIREHILAQSAAIVQDDTGIPFRYFGEESWQVRLYGGYDRPIPQFRSMVQPDLREAYTRAPDKPLGFHIGYGSGRKPSNLLVATRRPPQGG